MVKNKKRKESISFDNQIFSQANIIFFITGVLFIVFGFVIMQSGDSMSVQTLTLSPIILLIGYLILIPAALLYRKKRDRSSIG